MSPHEAGERKHETCRFGRLTEAWIVSLNGTERPTCAPLCCWTLPKDAPPGIARAWGGLVEFERDCAVCHAHQPIEITSQERPS